MFSVPNVGQLFNLSNNDVLKHLSLKSWNTWFCLLQDRAERAARYAQSQEEERAAKQASLQARQAEEEHRKEATLRERR